VSGEGRKKKVLWEKGRGAREKGEGECGKDLE